MPHVDALSLVLELLLELILFSAVYLLTLLFSLYSIHCHTKVPLWVFLGRDSCMW